MKKLLLLNLLVLPSLLLTSCGDKTDYETYKKMGEEAFNNTPMGTEVPYKSALLEIKGTVPTENGYKEVDLKSVYAYIGFTKQFRLQKTNSPEGVTYGSMPDTVNRPDLAKTPINYFAESTINIAAHMYPDMTSDPDYKMEYHASKKGFKYVQECSRGKAIFNFNQYGRLTDGKTTPKNNDPEEYTVKVTHYADKTSDEIEI